MPSFTPQEEEREERLAIIEYDGKMTRADAQKAYEQSQHISENHYSDKIKRIRELDTLQKVKRHHRVSSKKAAGND